VDRYYSSKLADAVADRSVNVKHGGAGTAVMRPCVRIC
jgi:hypothetical protein